MRSILPLFAVFPLAACGQSDSPQPTAKIGKPKVQASQPVALETDAQEQAREQGEDAAAVLRRYYDHIEAGRYDDAWAMRGGKTEGKEAFQRNFRAYETYRVTVGRATEPVNAAGWTFVEVPIQIFGRMKGGQSFGSAGSITVRRAAGAPGATAAQNDWHIYTGD